MTAVIAVIQARMGSSRVPGKAMIDLAGRPLLWHMIDRIRRVRDVGSIVLATTTDRRNESMIAFAEQEGVRVFQHPVEDDLAGRISGAIRGLEGEIILKTGGDCPLIDPDVLQALVDAAIAAGDADFVSNRVRWSYPLGLSADVLSRRAIEWCDANLTDADERELFAIHVRDHPDRFKVVPVVNEIDLSHHGWTLDEPRDIPFLRDIFDRLYVEGEVFSMADVLAYLETKGAA